MSNNIEDRLKQLELNVEHLYTLAKEDSKRYLEQAKLNHRFVTREELVKEPEGKVGQIRVWDGEKPVWKDPEEEKENSRCPECWAFNNQALEYDLKAKDLPDCEHGRACKGWYERGQADSNAEILNWVEDLYHLSNEHDDEMEDALKFKGVKWFRDKLEDKSK